MKQGELMGLWLTRPNHPQAKYCSLNNTAESLALGTKQPTVLLGPSVDILLRGASPWWRKLLARERALAGERR